MTNTVTDEELVAASMAMLYALPGPKNGGQRLWTIADRQVIQEGNGWVTFSFTVKPGPTRSEREEAAP